MALPSDRIDLIHNFVKEGIDLQRGRIETESDPFWKALCLSGSELWLDTGDIEAATTLWPKYKREFTTI